jgi:hypothetical protein
MKKIFLSFLLVLMITFSSEAQVIKASSLETLEKFSIDCQPFDQRKWEQGGVSPVYFNFKSKDEVTIYKYNHSFFLESVKPERLIYKKSGKYNLSLKSLRISEDGGSYTIDRATLVMKDYINSYNCEIFETFVDQESLMKERINLFIQEIKNKNKF